MLNPSENSGEAGRRTSAVPHLELGNRILDDLPAHEIERLVPDLRRVFLQREQIIGRPGEAIEYLHFPIDAFAWSWTETTGSDRPTSVMTVGHRGVLEWGFVLGSERAHACVTVISAGTVWRLPAAVLRRQEPNVDSPLRALLLRFANSCILNCACRLACNSEHNIDQRLARWLLWVSDEAARNEFSITHQQIADIAAIRRPSVSLALSQFQRDGLLRSQHGRLRLIARPALEKMVCRCYWNIKENTEAVFSRTGGRP